MSKELDEAWTTIYHYNDEIIHDMGSEYVENPLKEEIDIVNNALLELKAIKEANPSEALECLIGLEKEIIQRDGRITDFLKIKFNIIKQALIKAQGNARNEEILQKYYQEGITLDSVRVLKQERDNYKKVLNIIKEKNVDIYELQECKNVEQYNKKCDYWGIQLIEEEFDLLKEVK